MKSVFAWALFGFAGIAGAESPAPIAFDWFEYTGRDAALDSPLPAGSFRNPILAGYYPDPSVTRVGDKYYLVNSTFTHWPGIPIHESTDLVHWKLIGHALSDPKKISFDGLNTSRGVFAPSIHFHNGTYYIVNTLVDSGGNFFVTAKDPAGPWSDPIWLKEIDGIDPSFFFDDNGRAYVLNNGGPEGKPLYDGHRAIWIQEFDTKANKLVGQRRIIANGGADISKKPIWIEGPHLYRIKSWYYLMCAEGGTERDHSEVIFRAKSPWGPFTPFEGNPILTQRDLSADRPNPVTNAGHADLVQMKDGSWWAVFLASRPYEGYRFNTGRETYLLPVTWKKGWPIILEHGKVIPTTLPGPKAMTKNKLPVYDVLAGNFTKREEFNDPLGPEWIQVHVPKGSPYNLVSGTLQLNPMKVSLNQKLNTSFLARRQQHTHFDATTKFVPPWFNGVAAGLAAYQNEDYWYFFGTRRTPEGLQLFVERHAGKEMRITSGMAIFPPKNIKLRISGDGDKYSFYYDTGSGWQAVRENDDASFLSSEVAGGFVGTVLGPFARQE